MSVARRIDPELEVDYSERAGFLTGKSAAMADWAHRKEDQQYAKLFERLYRRNRRRLALVAKGIPFRDVDGVPTRIHEVVCHVCSRLVERGQPNAVWCSKACGNRYHGVARARARNRGIRNMTIAPTVITHLELEPGLTMRQLLERIPDAKYGSLASLLSVWVKKGVLMHIDKRCRGTRYALATLPNGKEQER